MLHKSIFSISNGKFKVLSFLLQNQVMVRQPSQLQLSNHQFILNFLNFLHKVHFFFNPYGFLFLHILYAYLVFYKQCLQTTVFYLGFYHFGAFLRLDGTPEIVKIQQRLYVIIFNFGQYVLIKDMNCLLKPLDLLVSRKLPYLTNSLRNSLVDDKL